MSQNREPWYNNADKIHLLSKFIRDNDTVELSDKNIIEMCYAIGIDPFQKRNGKNKYRNQLRMKCLEAKTYFEKYEIEFTSINFANYIDWKHAKYDRLKQRFVKKAFSEIRENIYIGMREPTYDESPVLCGCSETVRCRLWNKCLNK